MTPAEKRTARHAEQVQRLEDASRAVLESDGFRAFMRARRAFHSYSFHNQLLIAFQRPTVAGEPSADACTHVAGFNAWKKLDRNVKKGAKGIRIAAPMVIRPKSEKVDGQVRETGESDAPRVLFKVVSVFDISQTEGEPLPEPPSVGFPIGGDRHADAFDRLAMWAADKVDGLGLRIEEKDLSGHAASGWYDANAREIVVDSTLTVDERLRILTHECAHALGVGYEQYGRDRAEVIVETATTVALDALGFDTSGASVSYVASYGESEDLAALRSDLAKIDELATKLETACGVSMDTETAYADREKVPA